MGHLFYKKPKKKTKKKITSIEVNGTCDWFRNCLENCCKFVRDLWDIGVTLAHIKVLE